MLAAGPGCGAAERPTSRAAPPSSAAAHAGLFVGIPQRARALGSERAPYTLVLFADMQCPYCAAFDRDVLPAVIDRYVRTGRLRIVLRLIAFIGPDSAKGAAAAGAAELQDRGWQFLDSAYHRQGRENSGYWTLDYIRALARSVDGLDPQRFFDASGTPRLHRVLEQDARAAQDAGIHSTPGFLLSRTGGRLEPPFDGPVDRDTFLRSLKTAIGATSAAQRGAT